MIDEEPVIVTTPNEYEILFSHQVHPRMDASLPSIIDDGEGRLLG